jgi:hypothetical protein
LSRFVSLPLSTSGSVFSYLPGIPCPEQRTLQRRCRAGEGASPPAQVRGVQVYDRCVRARRVVGGEARVLHRRHELPRAQGR